MKLYDFYTVDIYDHDGHYFLWEDEPLEPLLFSLNGLWGGLVTADSIQTLYPNGDHLLAVL